MGDLGHFPHTAQEQELGISHVGRAEPAEACQDAGADICIVLSPSRVLGSTGQPGLLQGFILLLWRGLLVSELISSLAWASINRAQLF